MSAPVGIKQVAAHAGVSVGTVSNVLNRPHLVAEPTRERVQAAIAELGFVRNEAARQLRAGRSRSIGLVILDVANPFFTDVARGVEQAASEAGLAVILCNSDQQQDREARYLDLLEEQRVQGILITPVAGQRHTRIRRHGTPVVLLDRNSASRDQCSVGVDDVMGGELAVAHLLAQGHERIAFVGRGSLAQVRDRHTGALRAVEQHGGGRPQLTVVETEVMNVAAGAEAAARLTEIAAKKRPTAVFCANDLLALGVLREMTRQRARVPDDMAIVGYDDIDFAAAAAVPLSSVRQPREELGRTAAELLIDESRRADGHRHRQVTFTPELVVRESTEPDVTQGSARRGRPG